MASGIFTGLMMGATKQHWLDIVKRISYVAGSNPFNWSDIERVYPDITRKELSRLKCSGFIVKVKPTTKSGKVRWRLNPGCGIYINPQIKLVKKRIKK